MSPGLILADTSVWVGHFSHGDRNLRSLLEEGSVAMHSIVRGELATGNLPRRSHTLRLLASLPHLPAAADSEALHLIETHRLHGRGLHWNDILLAAACLIHHTPLWTRDRTLRAISQSLGCASPLT